MNKRLKNLANYRLLITLIPYGLQLLTFFIICDNEKECNF